jgi:1,2-diacylglycerol 3-alpha-glucosyltransferase
MHLVIIWQRFLPYHWARIRHANKRLSKIGVQFTAVEVASQDVSYGFPVNSMNDKLNYICCFPGESYHSHRAKDVYKKVFAVLVDVKPDIVFAPAIAFPEGIAAVAYRMKSGARTVSMDDSWEHTDRRGFWVKLIRKLIYRNADAVFVPSASHFSYYTGLGFEKERIIFGVDVVDNEYFMKQAELAHHKETEIRDALKLPDNYFLFVGRILPRKGIKTLLEAYKQYRETAKGEVWDLVIVGAGDYLNSLRTQFSDVSGLHYAGAQFGDDLCKYYGLARVLIVPNDSDPWGLVVNEAMASCLPVIVSSGCGAAKTLVRDAENGWIFKHGNVNALRSLIHRITLLSPETLNKMGKKSHEIIAQWTLDRFADGMLSAVNIKRRPQAGLISDVLTKLWKGRMQVT